MAKDDKDILIELLITQRNALLDQVTQLQWNAQVAKYKAENDNLGDK